jgi:uncharacterized protein (TIGR03435 family)
MNLTLLLVRNYRQRESKCMRSPLNCMVCVLLSASALQAQSQLSIDAASATPLEGCQRRRGVKSLTSVFVVALFGSLVAALLLCMTSGTLLAAHGLKAEFVTSVQLSNGEQFEAAAVKPVPASTPRRGRLQAVQILMPPGRLNVANATLNELIAGAYGLNRFQIVGGPGWGDTARFTVEATAPGSASREQRLVMLQNFLGERFKLKVHKERKELAVYALEVRKNTALRPLNDNELACWSGCANHPAPTNHMRLTNLSSLITYLMQLGADRPVVDKTGLTGNLAIDLDIEKIMVAAAEAGVDRNNGPSFSSIYDATVLAIEDTLGLKVAPAKAQLEVVVIDHVEPL